MTIPPMKDMTGRPAAELNGSVATSPIPTGTYVRVTGDEMTGLLQLKPATGNAFEVFDAANALNAFMTPAGALHVSTVAGDGTGLTGVVLDTEVGAASGVASLDSTGKVPLSQLPAFSLVDVFSVASQAAMLALSTAGVGDLAVRTDLSETFILSALPPSTLGNWILITPPSGVTSFNTRTGAVTPQAGDYDTFNDLRYLRLTGDTMTGPIVIDDPTAAHVPLTIQGAAAQTGNLTEWKNNTPVVVASVDPTGKGTFAGLQVNGNILVTGTVTFGNANLLFNVPNNSSFPTPLVVGVQYGFIGTGLSQGQTAIDERGTINMKPRGETSGGVVIDAQMPALLWQTRTALGGQVRITPAFNDNSWVLPSGTHASSYVTITGASLIIWPTNLGGGDANADAPSLLVVRRQNGTQDIQQWLSYPVGATLAYKYNIGGTNGVDALAGVRVNGNFWHTSNPPAHSNSAGTPGEIAWDGTYEYRCIAAASWQRTLRSTGTF